MGKIAKKLLILTAVFSLCAVSVTGCGKAKDTDVVAKVGDQEIPYGVANFYARMQQAQMESYYTAYGQDVDTLWAQELKDGDTYEESYRKSIMETLENFYLMEMHMEDYGVTITEEDKQKIEKAAEQFLSSNSDESKDVVSGKKEYVTRVLELMTIASRMEEPMKAEADVNVTDEEAAQKAKSMIEAIAKDIEVGEVYLGTVVRIMPFGAFVELLPGKDGMVHISKLARERVNKVEDVVNIGDEILVKVIEIDDKGRVNLTRKDLLPEEKKDEK